MQFRDIIRNNVAKIALSLLLLDVGLVGPALDIWKTQR